MLCLHEMYWYLITYLLTDTQTHTDTHKNRMKTIYASPSLARAQLNITIHCPLSLHLLVVSSPFSMSRCSLSVF